MFGILFLHRLSKDRLTDDELAIAVYTLIELPSARGSVTFIMANMLRNRLQDGSKHDATTKTCTLCSLPIVNRNFFVIGNLRDSEFYFLRRLQDST